MKLKRVNGKDYYVDLGGIITMERAVMDWHVGSKHISWILEDAEKQELPNQVIFDLKSKLWAHFIYFFTIEKYNLL